MRFPRFGAAPTEVEPAGPPPVGPIPPNATVVLLVEDEPAVRSLFGFALRREGYHVLEAGHGVEALEVADQVDHIDLVVTDIVMPVMKGPEMAVKMRERIPNLPVLFVSGYLVSDDLGPNAQLLTKPFVREDLVRRVVELIGPARSVN